MGNETKQLRGGSFVMRCNAGEKILLAEGARHRWKSEVRGPRLFHKLQKVTQRTFHRDGTLI